MRLFEIVFKTWLNDSRSERISYIKNGLITMRSFETPSLQVEAGQSWQKRTKNRRSFFSLVELMAANLKALLGAYEGPWAWPPPEPLPIDLRDLDQVAELR